MASPMNAAEARRAASTVGRVTACVGSLLAAVPERAGPVLGLADRRGARVVGCLDLLLVPGLLRADRQWPWLAARAVLNLPTAAYVLTLARKSGHRATRSRVFALGLVLATVRDSATVAALRRA